VVGVGEGVADPVRQVGARGLQDLEDVVAGNARHVGAESGIVDVLGGFDARVDGRAHVEVGHAGRHGCGPDAGRLPIAQAGDHGDGPLQVPQLGQLGRDVGDDGGGGEELRHLVGAHSGDVEQLRGPPAPADVEESQGVRGRRRGGPVSGEVEDQVSQDVDDPVGAVEVLRMVLAHPGHLVDRRRHARRLAGQLVDVGVAIAVDLLGGPPVQPQDAVGQRSSIGAERREGLTLMGQPDGADAPPVAGGQGGQCLPDGVARGGPPQTRIVLVVVHLRREQGDGALGRHPHGAGGVDDDGLGRLRRGIDGDDEGSVLLTLW